MFRNITCALNSHRVNLLVELDSGGVDHNHVGLLPGLGGRPGSGFGDIFEQNPALQLPALFVKDLHRAIAAVVEHASAL